MFLQLVLTQHHRHTLPIATIPIHILLFLDSGAEPLHFQEKKVSLNSGSPCSSYSGGCKHFSERGGASAAAAVSPAPLVPPTLVLSTKCKSSGLRRTSGSYRHVDTVVAEIRLFLSVQWRARFNRERMKGHVQNVGTKCSRVHVWQCDRAQHCGPRFLEWTPLPPTHT